VLLPVDSAIRATVRAHRAEFPERDRLLAEGRNREATERFPDYWPGWMASADGLAHRGGLAGFLPTDAIAALERTLALNPGFLPAWEHLHWMALAAQDDRLAVYLRGDTAGSTGGFRLALAGRHAAAADSLLNGSVPGVLKGLRRYLAGSWYLRGGDTTRAVATLRFPFFFHSDLDYYLPSLLLGGYVALDLARIAEAQGERELARMHYRQFLVRFDLPGGATQRAWIEEARRAAR